MSGTVQRHRATVAVGGAAAAAAAVIAISGPIIDHFEGNVLATYADPIGILTACRGHTGPELHRGQTFTMAECDSVFSADQRAVIKRIGACTKVPVPLVSFAAFTSFSFNVGSGAYCKNFAPMLDAGDLAGACRRLSRYVYAGGRPLPGLIRRRARERAVCEQGLST